MKAMVDFSNMRIGRLLLVGYLFCLFMGFTATGLAAPQLHAFKMVQQDNLMLHFDLNSANARAEMFTLTKPHRLVTVSYTHLTLPTKA